MKQIDWVKELELKEAEKLLEETKKHWTQWIYYGATSTSTTGTKIYYT